MSILSASSGFDCVSDVTKQSAVHSEPRLFVGSNHVKFEAVCILKVLFSNLCPRPASFTSYAVSIKYFYLTSFAEC